ncbi:MAG TPA: FAD/NAD(P)-binding oxidoreductase [Telluria sp.]|nr:FAD/NAD(P)-binding oxidoreductase [Telluria sp.]
MTIVIVGAGPAGLAAADAASAAGQDVVVLDENPAPGGQIWRGGSPAAAAYARRLAPRAHCRTEHGVRVVALAGPNRLLLETASGPRIQPWTKLILCGGARELLLPFCGWTLPGVTGAGGLQALAKGGLPLRGKRVVVAGSGPLLLASAATARAAGADVVAVAEARGSADLLRFGATLALRYPAKLAQAAGLMLRLRGVPYLRGANVVEALGERALRAVVLEHKGRRRELACDYLAAGFGLVPNVELGTLLGCASANPGGTGMTALVVDREQRTSVPGVWAAGECTGIGGVDKSLAEGEIAGRAAAGLPIPPDALKRCGQACSFGKLLARSFALLPALRALCRPSTLVCRCEDVSAARLAAFPDWRSAKLQTRAGMGPCQGRVCGSACEFLYGWEAPPAHPPIFPTTAATLASVAAPATNGDAT